MTASNAERMLPKAVPQDTSITQTYENKMHRSSRGDSSWAGGYIICR